MNRLDVLIIGAGLAGLYAARLLQVAGVTRFAILDARQRRGGRICAFNPAVAGHASPPDSFDLGATWIWPSAQPELDHLIRQLGLPRVAQEDTGELLFEHAHDAPVARYPGMAAVPPAFRLAGGMSRLVEAIGAGIDPRCIHLATRAVRISIDVEGVAVRAEHNGVASIWTARAVLLALSPRLATSTLAFDPPLPAHTHHAWASTPTHMAAHAKYVAVYSRNFWREQGFSGEARSRVGPLGEIHDASSPTSPALFGFFALPAAHRAQIPHEALKQRCRQQMARLFGAAALEPVADAIQDWSAEPFTATPLCGLQHAAHAHAPDVSPADMPWAGRLFGAGSEWSASHPGYLAGAIDASTRAVQALLSHPPERAEQ